MVDMTSFGVGCFCFGLKKEPPYSFEMAGYRHDIELFLQAMPNVSNVNISYVSVPFTEPVEVSGEKPTIETDEIPPLSYMTVKFEVYIPTRVQQDLIDELGIMPLTLSGERFRVSILPTYFCPVTFVEVIDSQSEQFPSQAVWVVREFLKNQEPKIGSDAIEFQFLGPTPFHADFHVDASDTEDEEPGLSLWARMVSQRGYDTVVFGFDPTHFAGAEDATATIIEEIADELGFFYRVKQIENGRIREWTELNTQVEELVGVYRQSGPIGGFRRFFSESRLNKIFISIADFELTELYTIQYLKEHYGDLYEGHWATFAFLQKYVDKSLKDRFDYQTQQLVELARLFDTRREKQAEVLITLVAALLGGVIGSGITLLLS